MNMQTLKKILPHIRYKFIKLGSNGVEIVVQLITSFDPIDEAGERTV